MFYEVIPGAQGLKQGFTYYYDGAEILMPGTLVEIPVGRAKVAGVVDKKVVQPDFQCKNITKILYSQPLPPHLVLAAKWLAGYYQAPLSSAINLMLPTGILKKRRLSAQAKLGNSPTETDSDLGTTPVDKTEQNPVLPKIKLNDAQKNALKALQQAESATKLLFGVTGSGKTNVYLSEAARTIETQKSVILLVPEIALTGQLVRVFRDYFSASHTEIVTIHSKQTEAERHLIFESLLTSSQPKIVIGPRSALFAPLHDLGLIIIDEEHESTFYQENSPKYSAVRVASVMAVRLKCTCLIGSATPAIEDYYMAKMRDSLVERNVRAKSAARKADIRVIDLKNREEFRKNRYFSDKLLEATARNLKAHRQTLIFHNRRGSAPMTLCENCGHEFLCPNCFLPLTLHIDEFRLSCHTCGHSEVMPPSCPECGQAGLIHKGFGTKLLESELKRIFPEAKIMRFDADTKKGEELIDVYKEVHGGAVDIIIGTQTIAKGLDLPKLATVGVVAADAGLMLPDFAAEERVFQLLTQVIGRVGRGHMDTAEVYVQTYRPEHPVIQYAVQENYSEFAKYLLKQRRKGGFPPYKYLMRLSITLKTERLVIKKVQEAARALGQVPGLAVSPPLPAFHEHTAKGYTWEIVVRSSSRKALIAALEGLDKNFKVTLDPPSLL